MKAVVFGCRSFLARHLIDSLLVDNRFSQIVGTSRRADRLYDACNQDAHYVECCANLLYKPTRLLTVYKPDIIFHLSGNPLQSAPNNEVWESHVTSTFNILESISPTTKPTVVYISSITVENNPFNLYSAAKLSAENLIKSYTQAEKINGIILRPCAIVGKSATHGVVPDIINKLHLDSNYLDLLTNSVKPFLYVKDFVNLMLDDWVLSTTDRRSWNVSNNAIPVERVADIIIDTMKIYKKIRFFNESYSQDQPIVNTKSHFNANIRNSETAVKQATLDIIGK